MILDPLNAPYRPGAPLSPVLPAAVRFAYRVVVAPPSAAPPQSFFGKVAATVRSWTGRGRPAPEPTPSIKEMKAAIIAAGLSVADLVEKSDVVERYRQALDQTGTAARRGAEGGRGRGAGAGARVHHETEAQAPHDRRERRRGRTGTDGHDGRGAAV